ncbi:MAG: cation transporter, partial [Spirochaetaceae bacterium]|nr:cation transporter [Spirochaetaceae bacterium]
MQTALKREYILDNLCCPKCAAKIEKHIGSLQGVNQAQVDFSVQKLIIEAQNAGLWDDIMTRTGEIIKRLEPSIELRDAVPFPNREAVKGKEPVPAKKWIRRLSLIL